MTVERVAVTRERLESTDRRIRELHDRLTRLRAGELCTPEDARRARYFATLQSVRAERARERLHHAHAVTGHHDEPSEDSATGLLTSRLAPALSEPAVQAAYERTRDGLVSVLLTQTQASPDDERRREFLLGTVERTRRPGWHGWARALCSEAASSIPSARGVAISMEVAGVFVPIGWSDGWSRAAEELHQTLGEGPPVVAYQTARPVSVPSVSVADGRWPTWASVAADQDVEALRTFPLPMTGSPIGAMTFYWEHGPVSAVDHADAVLVVELAEGLLWADAERIAHDLTDDLDGFGMIPIAAGMVAAQLGITVGAALARIRAHAFANGRTLRESAGAIVDRGLELF